LEIAYSSPDDTPVNPPKDDDSGLSSAAIAGIIIASCVFVVAVIIIIFVLVTHKKGSASDVEISILDGSSGSGSVILTTTDTTAGYAITPAQNIPATADDKTLVTVGFLTNQLTNLSSKSVSYEPNGEQELNILQDYSIGTLIGNNSWVFPYTSGSMNFVFSYEQVWYQCKIPLPSYLNPDNTPTIRVPLTIISSYYDSSAQEVRGCLQGIVLAYDTTNKTIRFERGQEIIMDNVNKSIKDSFEQINVKPWFWGLTCSNTF